MMDKIMNPPIIYTPRFISNPDEALATLQSELAWVQRDQTPRQEYYANDYPDPYTYGKGKGIRTYQPQPWHPLMMSIRKQIEAVTRTVFEVCFLNRYHDQRSQLGWHSDDSPEMDDARPIAIVSLGVEREIWFRKLGDKLSTAPIKKKLEHGSLCLMMPGMQDLWQHRIPKASFACGERISFTYRGYCVN